MLQPQPKAPFFFCKSQVQYGLSCNPQEQHYDQKTFHLAFTLHVYSYSLWGYINAPVNVDS